MTLKKLKNESVGTTDKVKTIVTYSPPTMIAAARSLPFEHIPCGAYYTKSNRVFYIVLAKCRKLVRHFKHSFINNAELKVSHGLTEESLVQDILMRIYLTLKRNGGFNTIKIYWHSRSINLPC